MQGLVNVPGTVADLSAGVVDLGQNNKTIGAPTSGRASFGGDVRLGRWSIGGLGYSYLTSDMIDRIDATGTLDLRASDVLETPHGPYTTLVTLPNTPLPEYLVLASYGNRLGRLDVSEITVSTANPSPVSGGLYPIIYTSDENAGPGEIRVLLPEPSTLLTAAGVVLLGRRRRSQ